EAPEDGLAILDLSRVTAVDEAAAGTLAGLSPALEAAGTELLVVGAARHPSLADALAALEVPSSDARRWEWNEPEEALEWCEDRLLERLGLLGPGAATVVAGSPLLVYRLGREALPRLSDDGDLGTRSKLLLNLAAGLSERLRRATAQLTVAA